MAETSKRPMDACPSDEWLAGYLTATLLPEETLVVDRHARTCGLCASALQVATARLRLADEIATPVPANLRQRVAPTVAATPHRSGTFASLRGLIERLAEALRPSMLLPLAAAAALLLMLGVQWRAGETVRSLPPLEQSTTLRIGAREALVRNQPTTRADVTATLSRGATVTYLGEDRDWYRIAMADGTEGWIEREALQR